VSKGNTVEGKIEKAIIVGIHIKGHKKDRYITSLKELTLLCETAGVSVSKSYLVSRDYIDSKFVLGTGKAKELLDFAKANDIRLIIFDEQLSPVQERNLRKYYDFKVLDRVEIILDIFAKHAATNEAKLQIELAQLGYLLPRLTRMWVHLCRQEGGVGVRGPGETQIEIDRRRIREKIHLLGKKLEEVRKHRIVLRKNREKQLLHTFALVGYTNAGKTSLLNRLTDSDSYVEDKLFCTLDPLSRQLVLSNGQMVILTDTVGFISRLPHFLIEAFKSTLEEVVESDYLLHVIDGSDENVFEKIKAVELVLSDDLNITDKEIVYVINKVDSMTKEMMNEIELRFSNCIFISAKTGKGTEQLKEVLMKLLKSKSNECYFFIPMDKLENTKFLYSKAVVVKEKYSAEGVYILAEVSNDVRGKLKDFEVKHADF